MEIEQWQEVRPIMGMSNAGPVMLLKSLSTDLAFPVFIGPAEVQAILLKLQGFEAPRPMTYDLFLASLRALKAELMAVYVTKLEDETFFSEIQLQSPQGELRIDARPSDAIALALTFGEVPIFVSSTVFGQVPTFSFDEEGNISQVNQPGAIIQPVSGDEILKEAGFSAKPRPQEKTAIRPPKSQPEIKLQCLQRELQKAVKLENFEQAAQLRDQIKTLEAQQAKKSAGN